MPRADTQDSFEDCLKRAVEQGGRDKRSGLTVVVQKQPDLGGINLDFSEVSVQSDPTAEE